MSEQARRSEIALNVTRTRLTVLVFNLTVIALMISILASSGSIRGEAAREHLTTTVALFVGFCLTLLGIFWLLHSQNLDTEGLSHPIPFTLGTLTTYVALSQTVTAFIHEYLLGIERTVNVPQAEGAGDASALVGLLVLGDASLLILVILGAGVWLLMAYVAPLIAILRCSVAKRVRWVFVGYYFAMLAPVYWVYAEAFALQYGTAGLTTDMLGLFALQFLQPLLWLG